MNIKGVLFDLDGTLLDTSELIVESFRYTFKQHCNYDISVSEVHDFFGKSLRLAMETLGKDKADELIDTYREHNAKYHDEKIAIFPEVAETIKTMYDNGIKLAVVTSKTKKTALRGLKLFGLESYFSTVIGINECINPKPHPEPVNIALQELKLAPEVCLMVGDSPADIMSGKQAGVKTVAVKWTQLDWLKLQEQEPDYVLQKMSDILKIS